MPSSSLRVLLLSFALVLTFGCTASSINTQTPEAGPYSPSNDKADGEVSYLNAGAKAVRDARRQDAYKKMYEHCGEYEITKEEDQQGMWGTQRRLWFTCLPKGDKPVDDQEKSSELTG